MVRKLSFTSLFYSTNIPWTSCKQARTKSFRAAGESCNGDLNVSKMRDLECSESIDSFFTNTSEELESFSTVSEGSEMEMVLRGLRSERRLFFEPRWASSIMEDVRANATDTPFEGSIAMTLDSEDPYNDFRTSMEEMVVAYGVGELEDLLGWYLKVNGKETHGFILGAFIDLVLMLSSPSSCYCPCSFTSSCSSTSSFEIVELEEEGDTSTGSY
ncbi:Ovate protein family C-terminal protein [Dioscorea alata]|uniref:Ovate protein family C-terminal protein n=1 Tax=Dioscorea alata TaxID=55571 RepID=A0ACB7US82_DIOAL|nr:Ovate protein family C-terminal protein [Dioscorea alata]